MSRDTVTIIEDETFNYLLFCSGVFSLDKKDKQGDRHFSHSPIGARTYEYHYSQWDHYAVIRCSPIAAEKLMYPQSLSFSLFRGDAQQSSQM